MRVLITGAGGFVGKRLSSVMAAAGHEVIALVHRAPADDDGGYFESPRISILEADLTALDFAALPKDTEAVIALAQSVHFREFPSRAESIFDINVTAQLRLLDWAIRSGVRRFVLASSGGVYGGKLGAQFNESNVLPVDSLPSFYLGSKLCAEIVFQSYREFFESAVIVRPFFIYGPAQRSDMFVARIVQSVREGRTITLQGRDGLKINPIYVDDAVAAFARAVDVADSRIINIAGADVVTLRTLANLAARHFGRLPIFQTAKGDPVDYVGNIAIARQVLGLKPRSFADGLGEMIRLS